MCVSHRTVNSLVSGEDADRPQLTFTARSLMQQCAGTVKKLSLELGGNAPFIVFDDADIEMAVKGAIASKYRNADQTCVCANRILVQGGIYDAFTKRLAQTAGAMKVADGFEPGAVIGPLIDTKAVEKVEAHIDDAVKKDAKVVSGARRHVLRADGIDRRHDRHWSSPRRRPSARWRRSTASRPTPRPEALEYGIVGINEGIISTEIAPFGAMKESGSAAKARNTASRNSSRLNTSAWAASTGRARLRRVG
jgi:succinate-semialdehyde dehydrogenase / glutarate-semialdehyde dehydrogenase